LADTGHRPDWYPDPTGRFEYRYHNGQAWTGDVSADGHRFLDPLAVARAAHQSFGVLPYGQQPSGQQRSGQPQYGQQPYGQHGAPPAAGPRTGKATAAFVLALSSVVVGWVPFLCVVAIAAAVVALVLGRSFLRAQRQAAVPGTPVSAGKGHGYALAAVILVPFGLAASALGIWLTVISVHAIQRFTDVGSYSITNDSCSVSGGEATYSGTLSNGSSNTRSYEVTIRFERAGTSSSLGTAEVAVNDVPAHESQTFSVSRLLSADSVSCSVASVTGPVPFGQS
jgi:hypothetical protein